MKVSRSLLLLAFAAMLTAAMGLMFAGCGDDDEDENEANRVGVGAMCSSSDDCAQCAEDDAECLDQECLTEFTGGYCGIAGCTSDDECPDGSRCVAYDATTNYCFLTCDSKPQCNVNRDEANEANCSGSVDFVDEPDSGKACVPPSSGI